jgi:RNA polymerase sigma-70 factor (ECF subfamily)
MDYLELDVPPSTCLEPPPTPTPRRGRGYLDDPDVRLMLLVRGGDDGAFAQLQARYLPRVLGYFCRVLRDRSAAEDLSQDVFLRLYRSRASYQPRARFSTWVFHVTRNVARNAVRSRQRRVFTRLDSQAPKGGELAGILVAPAEPPSRRLEREELACAVRAAVEQLRGRQRAAIEMHQLQGRSYAEVAAELHMTPKATKSLLYRARNQLREALKPLVR